jgi:hypothetical protein
MPFQPIARSPDSAVIKAMDARGLEALTNGQERRRAMWSFLTWAFFLSEAFKGKDAYAEAPRPVDDPDGQPPLVQDGGTGAAPLPSDEPGLKDWVVAFPSDGTLPGPAAHAFSPLVPAGQFDKLSLGDGVLPRPVQGAGASSGGADHRSAGNLDANSDGDIRHSGADTGFEVTLSLFDVPLDANVGLSAGLGIGLSNLSLPLLGATAPILPDLINEMPLAGIADHAAAAIAGLDLLAQSLVDGVLASGGVVTFSGSPVVGAADTLLVGGRYTDYHLTLQAEGSNSSNFRASEDGSNSSNQLHVVDDLVPAHASHGDPEAGSHNMVLPSVVDELVLRGSIEHLM